MYRHGHQTQHRLSKTPEYKAYHDAKQRCYLTTNKNYAAYGGRGITMSGRWLEKPNGFKNFLEDMGYRPSPDHSLDRVDGDKGYSKENCRWATSGRQTRNRGVTLRDVNGEALSDIAQRTGIKYDTVYHRYLAGLRGVDLSRPVSDIEPQPTSSPIAPNLGRAINELIDYAHDLDNTERPAEGEYDVTADIRLVCQALIDALSPPPTAAPVPSPDGAGDLCIDCDGSGKYPSGNSCKSCAGTGHVCCGDGIKPNPSGTGAAEPVGWLWHSQDDLEWKYSHGPKEPECWKIRQPVFATSPVGGDRETLTALLPFIRAGDVSKGEPSFYFADGADAILSLPVQPGAGERGSDAAEADRYFDLAGEFGHQLQALAGVVQDAVDFLAERKQGNAARSPGHNARVILETALKSVSPSALPVRQAPQSSREG